MENKLITSINLDDINDFIGQNHLLNKNGIITKMIENQKIFSIIFYGYPGVGKSTLARLICAKLNFNYFIFNPTINNKKDLDLILKEKLKDNNQIVIIIDEFHRMNKDKQDILLNYLEKNQIILFATTTENPYFTINPAIRSRCHIIKLEQINNNEMLVGLKKISNKYKFKMDEEILKAISSHANGDVRVALNSLQILNWLYKDTKITKDILQDFFKSSYSFINKDGDELHDVKSALHKSIRGSDVDASLYYLARLIKSNDLIAISRRLIACAYEDIGMANPSLLSRVVVGIQAAERVGFPECEQILACITIEMALSPKSNSAYLAIKKAIKDNDENGKQYKVPAHIRDNNYASSIKFNKAKYLYPHDFKNHWVKQQYLPNELINETYYLPSIENEIEKKYFELIKKLKQMQNN